MPTYIAHRKTKEQRRKDYIKLKTEFAKEGDFTSLLELGLLGEDAKVKEVLDARRDEAMRQMVSEPQRTQLNRTERENIARLLRVIRGGGQDAKIGQVELKAYIAKLLGEGVCEKTLEAEIAKAVR